VEHRATLIFRREQGKWKLVHHHTDLSAGLEELGAQAEHAVATGR
jgi:ketosteroid isomerase-like protein